MNGEGSDELQVEAMLEAERDRDELPSVSAAKLDAAIAAGLAEGRRRKRASRSRSWALGSAAAILVLFFGLVRVSPAVASYMGGLPGVGILVQLVADDPGLKDALKSEFIQPVGVEDAHDGVAFTIDGIIADEERVNVFYTVRTTEPFERFSFRELRVADADTGAGVQASYSFNYPSEEKPGTLHRGRIDIGMSKGVPVPDRMRIRIKPNLSGVPEGSEWSADFAVDKERFLNMKEIVEVEQPVAVEGQRFTVVRTVIHPTRIAVELEMDPANSKRLFSFSELKLADERGNELRSLGASITSETKQTLYFESNYFREPKHLTLSGGRIMALDRTKLQLKVDLEQKRIVEAPDDRVRIVEAGSPVDGKIYIILEISRTTPRDQFFYTIVEGPAFDAEGRELKTGDTRTFYPTEEDRHHTTLELLTDGPVSNPVTFNISNYPAWIEEPFRVKLK